MTATPRGPDKAEGSDGAKTPELTPWEKFVETTKRVLAVPKAELDKRETAWRKKRAAKKRRRKS